MDEWVTLCDGVVKVNRDGVVKRLGKNGWETAPHIYTKQGGKSEERRVKIVTITYTDTVGGFVSRSVKSLVAEAFIDSYERGTNITHKNGNYKNVSVDNLELVDYKTHANRAYESRLNSDKECTICHKKVLTTRGICPSCRKKQKEINKKVKSDLIKTKKLDRIKEKYKYVNRDVLDQREISILNDRLKGDTLEKIGEKHGVTREAIRLVLLKIEDYR